MTWRRRVTAATRPAPRRFAALAAYLESWPVDKLFPLLDLCRMAALRGDAAGVSREVASAMAAACARSVAEAPRLPANLLTAGRLFCNAFRHEVARDAFVLRASEILVRPRPKEPNSDPDIVPLSSSLSTGDVFLPRIVPWPALTKSLGEILRAATHRTTVALGPIAVPCANRPSPGRHETGRTPTTIPASQSHRRLPSRSLPRTRSRRPRQTRRLNSNARLFLVSARRMDWPPPRRPTPRPPRGSRSPPPSSTSPRASTSPTPASRSAPLGPSPWEPSCSCRARRRRTTLDFGRSWRSPRSPRTAARSASLWRKIWASGTSRRRCGCRAGRSASGRGGRPQAGDVEVRSRRRKISEGGERFGGGTGGRGSVVSGDSTTSAGAVLL